MTGLSASCYTLPLPLPLDELLVTVYDVCMMSPVDCSGQIQVTSRTSVYKQSIAQMHGAPHHAITSSMDSYILALLYRSPCFIGPSSLRPSLGISSRCTYPMSVGQSE